MAKIDALFEALMRLDGSDLHLLETQPPKIRQHGRLIPLNLPVLDADTILEYMREICPGDRWERFMASGELDFSYAVEGLARFRANFYHHVHGMGAVFRLIPVKIMSIDELGLPQVLKRFANLRSGLVLCTGPTGSGKSTTLAATINHINEFQSKNIVTIEQPVEFVHTNKKSFITHRDVGTDVKTVAEGVRAAMRQDTDILLVGELRDQETIALTISAANMGMLVFATLHTISAVKTVDRIIETFPVKQQPQARGMLAEALKGVCAQLLLKRADQTGRIAVNEILIGGQALATCIREANLADIRNIIQAGKRQGMQMMDDQLTQYLQKGYISAEEAYMHAHDKSRFSAEL